MRSGMFTSVNGDRKYTSAFFAEYFASFIGNGVFPNPSTNTQVLSSSGMNVSVQPGKAWIDGYILFLDNDETLTLDVGDNLLPRIDKIVIRLDKINREIVLAIKKGTPATNPTAPNLQRDGDIHELGIADVYVARAASSITQANITDLRLNSEQCGLVVGTVNSFDTTTLFNQYQDWLDDKQDEFNQDLINYIDDKQGEINSWYDVTTVQLEQDFTTWFNTLENLLDESAVGNLTNLINANTTAIEDLETQINNVESYADDIYGDLSNLDSAVNTMEATKMDNSRITVSPNNANANEMQDGDVWIKYG